jgi:hypothetical protein
MDKTVSLHYKTPCAIPFYFSIAKKPHNCNMPYIICHERMIKMQTPVFYTPGGSAALDVAKHLLETRGCRFTVTPEKAVTHLLLGVPAKEIPEAALEALPPDITVIGGRLDLPALSGYRKLDLLEDPFYLAENADITARCAIRLAAEKLPVTYKGLPVLVAGWGRIGKCLARLLKHLDAEVWVLPRQDKDRAMLAALGYGVGSKENLSGYRIVFNTADNCRLQNIPRACLKVDLASVPGICDADVIWARGLPGTLAPESSGKLIAETVLRLLK